MGSSYHGHHGLNLFEWEHRDESIIEWAQWITAATRGGHDRSMASLQLGYRRIQPL